MAEGKAEDGAKRFRAPAGAREDHGFRPARFWRGRLPEFSMRRARGPPESSGVRGAQARVSRIPTCPREHAPGARTKPIIVMQASRLDQSARQIHRLGAPRKLNLLLACSAAGGETMSAMTPAPTSLRLTPELVARVARVVEDRGLRPSGDPCIRRRPPSGDPRALRDREGAKRSLALRLWIADLEPCLRRGRAAGRPRAWLAPFLLPRLGHMVPRRRGAAGPDAVARPRRAMPWRRLPAAAGCGGSQSHSPLPPRDAGQAFGPCSALGDRPHIQRPAPRHSLHHRSRQRTLCRRPDGRGGGRRPRRCGGPLGLDGRISP